MFLTFSIKKTNPPPTLPGNLAKFFIRRKTAISNMSEIVPRWLRSRLNLANYVVWFFLSHVHTQFGAFPGVKIGICAGGRSFRILPLIIEQVNRNPSSHRFCSFFFFLLTSLHRKRQIKEFCPDLNCLNHFDLIMVAKLHIVLGFFTGLFGRIKESKL